jgi:hypothetical protein
MDETPTVPPEPATPASSAYRPLVPPPPPPTPKRRRTLIIVVAAVVAVLAVAGGAVAIGWRGTRSAAASSPGGTGTDTANPTAAAVPPAPGSLQAHAKPFAVSLHWTAGTGEGTVGGYTIYRDNAVLNATSGTGVTYVDKTALPEERYDYQVEAFAPGGAVVSSSRASVHVRTPAAPLATARFSGIFNVHLHLTSSYGLSRVDNNKTAGWRFTPKCNKGPCSARMSDLQFTTPAIMMSRRGAAYQGAGSDVFGTCSGTKVMSSFHVSLRVTDAKPHANEWRVLKFEGTFTTASSAQLGCVAGGTTYAVAGKMLSTSH